MKPKSQIIDFHAHVAGIGVNNSRCYVSPDLQRNWRFKIYLNAFNMHDSELGHNCDALIFERLSEKLMESKSVSAAVVLALDGVIDSNGELDLERTEMYIPNDHVRSETQKYLNLLYGASINPYRRDALDRLKQAEEDGAVLIKWLPAIQNIDPSDKQLIPFYRTMKELGLPLLVHTGAEKSFTRARHDVADPQLLKLPLSTGVVVIAAHAASTGRTDGEDNMMRLIRMFDDHPSLYTDISSLTQLNKLGYLKRLLKYDRYHDRLIYGTDFPLINTSLVSPWYFPLSLTWQQMRRISREPNPWDRDVALKSALGVSHSVFIRGTKLFIEKKL